MQTMLKIVCYAYTNEVLVYKNLHLMMKKCWASSIRSMLGI